jgi:hypothetical protein
VRRNVDKTNIFRTFFVSHGLDKFKKTSFFRCGHHRRVLKNAQNDDNLPLLRYENKFDGVASM